MGPRQAPSPAGGRLEGGGQRVRARTGGYTAGPASGPPKDRPAAGRTPGTAHPALHAGAPPQARAAQRRWRRHRSGPPARAHARHPPRACARTPVRARACLCWARARRLPAGAHVRARRPPPARAPGRARARRLPVRTVRARARAARRECDQWRAWKRLGHDMADSPERDREGDLGGDPLRPQKSWRIRRRLAVAPLVAHSAASAWGSEAQSARAAGWAAARRPPAAAPAEASILFDRAASTPGRGTRLKGTARAPLRTLHLGASWQSIVRRAFGGSAPGALARTTGEWRGH